MYPRLREQGSIYYITSNIHGRLRIFTKPSFILPIFDSLNFYRFEHKCKLLGYVIMPDHLHLLLRPVEHASSISEFMRDLKRFTSGRIARQAELESRTDWTTAFKESGKQSQRAEKQVWQASFWEQMIWSEPFVIQKLNYIHMNPVRAGLASDPADYPHSSYRNYEFDDNSLIDIDKDW
ncbi:MAG TPA: transposase [Anaerolineales bacterium]|jgi:REP element-mobilizing transposase RayT